MLGNTLGMDCFIAIILREFGWWLKNSKISSVTLEKA